MRTFYVKQKNKITLITGITAKKLFSEMVLKEGRLVHPSQPLVLIPGVKITISKLDGGFVSYQDIPSYVEPEKNPIVQGLFGALGVCCLFVVFIGINQNGTHIGGWVMKWLIGY